MGILERLGPSLCLLVIAPAVQGGEGDESSARVALRGSVQGRVSVHGRLDYRDHGHDHSGPDRVAGTASYHRSEVDGVLSLEWQLRFSDGEGRLIHIERRDARGESLIWREIGRLERRTLRVWRRVDEVDWTWTEWTHRGERRGTLTGFEGSCLPLLALDDALRDVSDGSVEGAQGPEATWVFDPLGLGFQRVLRRVEPRTEIYLGSSGEHRLEGHDSILEDLDGTPRRVLAVREGRPQGAQWPKAGLHFRAFAPGTTVGQIETADAGPTPASAPR